MVPHSLLKTSWSWTRPLHCRQQCAAPHLPTPALFGRLRGFRTQAEYQQDQPTALPPRTMSKSGSAFLAENGRGCSTQTSVERGAYRVFNRDPAGQIMERAAATAGCPSFRSEISTGRKGPLSDVLGLKFPIIFNCMSWLNPQPEIRTETRLR